MTFERRTQLMTLTIAIMSVGLLASFSFDATENKIQSNPITSKILAEAVDGDTHNIHM